MSEVLLTLDRVNLVFNADVHRTGSWRDAFVRLSQDPVGILLAQKDRLHVIRNLSLTVHNGDRIALMGVNGAGKTSICRTIAGIYKPRSGTIKICGKVRAVFDTGFGILPELTGRENVTLLAQFMYAEDPQQKQIIQDAMDFSELGKFLDVPYKLYSNGMQARLCLSLVSSRPCEILILDEVFDGADSFFREKVSARVVKMIEQSGAVFFVSHSAEQVKKVCNRLIVLHAGEIGYDGPVNEGLKFYEGLSPEYFRDNAALTNQ